MSTRERLLASVPGIVALMVTAGCASTVGSAGPTPIYPNGWLLVAPPGTGFACEMPAQPRIEQRVADLGFGPATMTVGMLGSDADDVALVFSVVDLPEDVMGTAGAEETLDLASRPLLENGAQVRSSRDFVEAGFVGRDLVTVRGPVVTHTRILRGLNRLYVVAAVVRGDREGMLQPVIARYLGSARTAGADARRRTGDGALQAGVGTWRYVVPDDMAFAIEMPGDPQRTVAEVMLGGQSRRSYTFAVAAPDGSRSISARVIVTDVRPSAEMIAALRTGRVQPGDRVTADRAVVVRSFAGRDLVLESPRGVSWVRYCITGRAIYELVMTVPMTEAQSASPAARRFLDSLRLL